MEIKGKVCRIVGAGEMFDSALLPLAPQDGDLLIAADGGVRTLLARSLTPDMVIGDFDSLGYPPMALQPIVLPCEKDDTDMLSALRLGLERGCDTFLLYGGTGGREDHTIANIQLLYYLASLKKRGYLIGKQNILTAIQNDTAEFTDMKGFFSVFCAGARAEGVTISGCKYTLENGSLTNLYPIGVSNEFLEQKACVSVRDGMLLLVMENCG